MYIEMKRITLFWAVLVYLCTLTGCSPSSGDVEEPVEEYVAQPVLGCWHVTAYKTSDGMFTPNDLGESFDFAKDGTCTHRGMSGESETFTFTFNRETNTIFCRDESAGWDIQIHVTFTGADSAVFDIRGKTANQSRTIKAERK